jgi:hypothetical protein
MNSATEASAGAQTAQRTPCATQATVRLSQELFVRPERKEGGSAALDLHDTSSAGGSATPFQPDGMVLRSVAYDSVHHCLVSRSPSTGLCQKSAHAKTHLLC